MLHMATIGVRELRQNASVYLAMVQRGEVVEVSVRGKVVAKLVPAVEDQWERLVANGQVRLPTHDLFEDVEPVDLGVSLTDELMVAREDER